MTEICARLHVKRWINLHSLRHTFATTLLNAGISLLALMEILGHKCITMTLVYAKLAQVKLREDCRAALSQMTETYVPKLMLENSNSDDDGAAIDEEFQRLQSLLRRKFEKNNGISSHNSKQFISLSNRLSKLKTEFLKPSILLNGEGE